MKKNYILDTNILIDDPDCIKKLINGDENNIFISSVVLNEIDNHKHKTIRLKPQINNVIKNIIKYKKYITIFGKIEDNLLNDDNILKNIIDDKNLFSNGLFITNDKILRFKAEKQNIKCEDYKSSIPFKSESEIYTGFVDIYTEELIENCFFYHEGKLYQYKNNEKICKNYEMDIWKVKPITKWQNACMMLLDDNTIPLVSIQSQAGTGKSFLALAAALRLVLEKKKYKNIYIIKSNIEIGTEMGFLPGNISEKMDPFFRPIHKLLIKLNNLRSSKKIFNDDVQFTLNNNLIECMPINFLRGWDIENAVVIFDEVQNISRSELRTFLSRMGKNVKCICTGDVNQIDNNQLNKNNNGMNWMIKKFKNEKEYAHILLGGEASRGPIANMVNRNNL